MAASEQEAFRRISRKLVEAEERGTLMSSLIERGLGFKEEEDFMIVAEAKLKGGRAHRKKKEIVSLTMKEKFKDNSLFTAKLRKKRNQARKKLEEALGPKTWKCKAMVKQVLKEGADYRKCVRDKNTKKLNFLAQKYGDKGRGGEELLGQQIWKKYEGLKLWLSHIHI